VGQGDGGAALGGELADDDLRRRGERNRDERDDDAEEGWRRRSRSRSRRSPRCLRPDLDGRLEHVVLDPL
jgi:hypothetical protein